jgi:hypothetical protein
MDVSEKMARAKPGVPTAETIFYAPILIAIRKLGGEGSIVDITRDVEKQLSGGFTKYDYRPSKENKNKVWWQDTLSYSLHRMSKKSLIEKSDKRGVWKLAEHKNLKSTMTQSDRPVTGREAVGRTEGAE